LYARGPLTRTDTTRERAIASALLGDAAQPIAALATLLTR